MTVYFIQYFMTVYFRFRWVNTIHYYVENYMTIFSSFSANFPPHSHTILAISCVHASNWSTHLQQTWQIDNSVLTVYVQHVHNYILRGILGCHGNWPQKPYPFISHSTQVNFRAHPQVHMGEMHQDTVLRNKVLLQWSVNAHVTKTLRLKVSYG